MCLRRQLCFLGELSLLPKMHKKLFDVPGQSVISNCGAPTEDVSEFFRLPSRVHNAKRELPCIRFR